MKRKFILLTICIAIISVYIGRGDIKIPYLNSTAFAIGDLVVDWGVTPGNPIFTISGFAPGMEETRTVNVDNGAPTARPVGVMGIKTSETASFAGVLFITIKENGSDIYGGGSSKTLQQFFDESSSPDGAPLSTLNPGDDTDYEFIVHFDESAGNAYQNAQIVFDLKIGIASDIPQACEERFEGSGIVPIFGTAGNDRIQGTNKDDLIFALEGNDRVFGHGGNDCIVGGSGNDELRGELGNDSIFGNEGNDLLIGAVGRDTIFGDEGDDDIRGENNDDALFGGSGNDFVRGGNGNDVIDGNDGDDDLRGENGTDVIHGNENNDTLNGGAGGDQLFGDGGIDSANGTAGTDTCDAEVETNCEL